MGRATLARGQGVVNVPSIFLVRRPSSRRAQRRCLERCQVGPPSPLGLPQPGAAQMEAYGPAVPDDELVLDLSGNDRLIAAVAGLTGAEAGPHPARRAAG